jgi:hypothetical protein
MQRLSDTCYVLLYSDVWHSVQTTLKLATRKLTEGLYETTGPPLPAGFGLMQTWAQGRAANALFTLPVHSLKTRKPPVTSAKQSSVSATPRVKYFACEYRPTRIRATFSHYHSKKQDRNTWNLQGRGIWHPSDMVMINLFTSARQYVTSVC